MVGVSHGIEFSPFKELWIDELVQMQGAFVKASRASGEFGFPEERVWGAKKSLPKMKSWFSISP